MNLKCGEKVMKNMSVEDFFSAASVFTVVLCIGFELDFDIEV